MVSIAMAVFLAENLEELCNGGALLTNGHVHAVEMLLFVGSFVDFPLVQDGVDCDGSLACLPISNDKLSLPAANGDEAVHSLEPSRHWLVDALTRDDARSLELDTPALCSVDGAKAINGNTQGIDHTPKQLRPNRHIHDGASALNRVSLNDCAVISKDHHANVVSFEIERHALQAARKLHHLSCLHALESIDSCNTITNTEDAAHLLHVLLVREVCNAFAQDLCQLCWAH